VVLLVAMLTFVRGAAAEAPRPLPALPSLPLETYEPGIREPIADAYRSVQEKPEDAERNGRLGMILYASEQYDLAAVVFARARALAPADARWAYYLGRTEVYLAQSEPAAASLREALRLRPGYLPARLMLAKSLLEAGRSDEAQSAYEAIAREHPDTAEAHYGLGRIAASAGETSRAVTHFEKASALFPAFGAAHFALARAYRDLGNAEKAQEQLALYQQDKLGWPAVADPLLTAVLELKTGANAHLRRGIELAEKDELRPAVEEHESALREDPKLLRAHVNLIQLYARLGEPKKAAEHFRAAVAIEPGMPEAENNYAYLLMTSGRLEEAAEHYRAAIESKPDYRLAHFNLSRILVQQGRLLEAIEHLQKTLVPEDEETPRNTYALGAAYARAGNRQEALKYMREAWQKATARGQADLLRSIEKDLRALGEAPPGP
jgi:tetratricopeptide (TPR) repeat protein